MKNYIVWVAWMARWDNPSPDHAYAAGIFDSPEKANEQGEAECNWRGGKYHYQFCPAHIDMPSSNTPYGQLIELPDKPLVIASVAAKTSERRVHFLGVFTTKKKAKEAKKKLYPGWKLMIEKARLNERI